MFADSLLETSWAHRSQRSWTTLTSFGLQAVVVGLLLLIPLLTTVGLPLTRVVSTPITMGRRDPGPAPQAHTVRSGSVQIIPFTGRIITPSRTPIGIHNDNEVAAPIGEAIADPTGLGRYVGDAGAGLSLPISGTRAIMPVAPPPAVAHVIRTSNMLQGSLIRRVDPAYPQLAKNARVQGVVVLAAVISKAGTIEDLRLISGHPMLVKAAIDAVSQWRYRPYILNGDAVEVDTQITVNFTLGGS